MVCMALIEGHVVLVGVEALSAVAVHKNALEVTQLVMERHFAALRCLIRGLLLAALILND